MYFFARLFLFMIKVGKIHVSQLETMLLFLNKRNRIRIGNQAVSCVRFQLYFYQDFFLHENDF